MQLFHGRCYPKQTSHTCQKPLRRCWYGLSSYSRKHTKPYLNQKLRANPPNIHHSVLSTERNNTHDQVLPQHSYKVPIPNQYIFGEKTLKQQTTEAVQVPTACGGSRGWGGRRTQTGGQSLPPGRTPGTPAGCGCAPPPRSPTCSWRSWGSHTDSRGSLSSRWVGVACNCSSDLWGQRDARPEWVSLCVSEGSWLVSCDQVSDEVWFQV